MRADDGARPGARRRLRLATLNLQHGRSNAGDRPGPPLGSPGLARAVSGIDVDLLALQEVDVGQSRTWGVDQAAVVAEATGLRAYRFAAAVSGDVRGTRVRARPSTARPGYGVALASRHPVLAWFVQPLPGVPTGPGGGVVGLPDALLRRIPGAMTDEPRVLLAAVVQTPAGRLVVGATHLSRAAPLALWQLLEVRRRVAALAGSAGRLPAVVLGDLNLEPPSARRAGTLLASAPTFPAWGPTRQIDHVLGVGEAGEAVAAGPARVERLAVSDHALLHVEIRLG